MATLRYADVATGCVCLGFGALLATEAYRIPNPLEEPLHPSALPLLLSGITMFFGGLLAVRAWWYKGEDPGVQWPAQSGWMRILATLGMLAGLFLTLPFLGLPVAAAFFVTGLTWFLERTRIRALATGLGVGLVLYFVFIKFLELPFPLGLLETF